MSQGNQFGVAVATTLFEGHKVRSRKKSMVTAIREPNDRTNLSHGRPALAGRLLGRLLDALHDSRTRLAARELRRYRHLIQGEEHRNVPKGTE